jgi:GT2 family glycosyltransferase
MWNRVFESKEKAVQPAATSTRPSAGAPGVEDAKAPARQIVGRGRLAGFFDRVTDGVIVGWVLDNQDPERPVEVAIWCGDRIVAAGVANLPRVDLVKTFGITGRNGFELPLHAVPLEGGHGLVMRERDTNQPIDAPEFRFQANDDALHAEIKRLDHTQVVVAIENSGPAAAARISLFDGDDPIHTSEQGFGNGETEIRFNLPSARFDGRAHLLGIGIGKRGIVAMHAAILRPILTPWEHLKKSHELASMAGLQAADAARYFSLRTQLARKDSPVTVESLVRAHDVVCATDFTRTEFPPLDLPVWDRPRVSVIIPVFNKFPETYHCVASLILAYNETSFEVIVADDCSTDETTKGEEILRGARFVRTPQNGGFNRNCNHAAKQARGEFIVFLNNDTEVTSFWLDELIDSFARFERVGMTGSKLLNADGTLQEAGGIVWGNGQPWNVGRNQNPKAPEWNYARQVDYLSGAALCLRKTLWDEVGGFSRELEPAYYEDTDLAFKVRAAGYTTWYVPTSEVVHFEGRSHGRDVKVGVKRFQEINAAKFKRKWVQAFAQNGEVGVKLQVHKDRGVVGRALVIDYTTPAPKRDAGGYAALQEMLLLHSLGLKVSFVPENMAHLGEPSDALRKLGIEMVHAPFYVSIEEFLAKRGSEFDLVYLTRYDVAQRHLPAIRKHTKAKVALNLADLHFLRALRSVARGAVSLQEAIQVRDHELEVLRKVDAVLSYNEMEKAVILSHNLNDEHVFHCPWVAEAKPTPASFAERRGLLFVGSSHHPPNLKAIEWFLEEIQPAIDLPDEDKKLVVVGSGTDKWIDRFAPEQVEVLGFVDDLATVFDRVRVFVAPLQFGAGIKGKVLEAMSHGVPIVGTAVAVEATGLVDGVSTAVADRPADFARAIEQLSTNAELWRRYRESELATVERGFSRERGRQDFSRMLDYLGVVHRT